MRTLLFYSLLLLCIQAQAGILSAKPKPVVIGYVAGYSGLVKTENIDAGKLTHINYAFVDVKDNRAWLRNERTDTVNFRKLNLLKQINPDLRIMISIGGWSWSRNFSDAALTDSSRQAFAASAVHIIATNGLDGIDIDWEYPGMRGDAGHIFRPEDKGNFTLLMAALRQELDKLQSETKRYYQLTAAVGGFNSFIDHTEMGKVQQYLDYINLMTYDYGGGRLSAHHTNLYAPAYSNTANSAEKAIEAYKAAGVPAGKLVMGIAFYGRGWQLETTDQKGLQQKVTGSFRAGGFSLIKDSLENRKGYKTYWDKKAKAPYLLNTAEKKFISYDNERSVKLKCSYVKKQAMGGVMFWEYSSDPKGYLLNTIYRSFR
ncbi:glycoside hydrolase family 18 protein [Sediminibacterium ginsengisoli]|uniref:chitinase n=1 Tax=Sediminibacterium ginsengisoli TaxID=413434 RepID=A0A1T4RCF9_9BACT|nr:glycoside hydrolase family 18 protein [Sediminibacterium ginsengisoli]SKA13684.1 chitinase [Sediminibacterium ginsengisoli]